MERNILLFLLGFLGLGALGGGGVFILSPSGKMMGMPVSSLAHSPFPNFLLPGIILFSVLGLAPLGLVYALWKKPKSGLLEKLNFFTDMHWAWTYSIYLSFALLIWIQVEMVMLQAVHWLHTFYMGYAIGMIFVGLLPRVREEYRK